MPDGVTRQELAQKKLLWLLDRSFLSHLQPADQDRMLATMSWRQFQPGEKIIEFENQGHGMELLVTGQVRIQVPQEGRPRIIATSREGALVGERALYHKIPTTAEVEAQGEVTTLHLPAVAFHQFLVEVRPFREYIEHLVNLRAEWPTLKEILDRNPYLGFLPSRELERLLASGKIISLAAGESLIKAGEMTTDVYVVIHGNLEVYAATEEGQPRRLLSVQKPGELNGIAAVMLEQPRIADVEARDAVELLRVSSATFMEVVNANPPVRRRLMQHLATLNYDSVSAARQKASRMVVFMCGARGSMGTTTLSYGVAANLQSVDPVTLVDLEGERTAKKLGFETRESEFFGARVQEMSLPPAWNMRVIWPTPGEDPKPLLQTLRRDDLRAASRVMVSGEPGPLLRERVLEEVDAVVYVRRASDFGTPSEARGKMLFQAIRIEEGVPIDPQTSARAVRIPEDRAGVDAFWREGSLKHLDPNETVIGRATARLARLLRGRSVGLALGGGGALGFAHIGLLRVLERNGFPIDYVAGVSFGALVAGVYVGGGMPALKEMIDRRKELTARVLGCVLTSSFLGAFVDRLTGNKSMGSTEVPFIPVGLDMDTGQEYVLPEGTLGEGVQSSSCMPGAFPAMRFGEKRLVDGGVVNNVPATTAWQAGADFILASNIIPTNPLNGRGIMGRIPFGRRLLSCTLGRVDDLIGALYTLMSQTGRDRALMADYIFDPDLLQWDAYDFLDGDHITDEGEREAEERLPAIKKAYEKDRSIRF